MSDTFANKDRPFIRRRPAVAAAAAVVLAAGIVFAVRGGTSTDTYVENGKAVVTCTGTGGLAKYAYCNWQEPTTNAGSGVAITGITYIVGKSPVAVGVDFTIGSSATVSGSVAIPSLTDVLTATGTIRRSSTGATFIYVSEGDYLRAVTLTDPTTTHRASMVIEYISRLSK